MEEADVSQVFKSRAKLYIKNLKQIEMQGAIEDMDKQEEETPHRYSTTKRMAHSLQMFIDDDHNRESISTVSGGVEVVKCYREMYQMMLGRKALVQRPTVS